MATDTSTVVIPPHLRPILEATAQNVLHHLYGSDGLPWGTSLAHLEGLTVARTRCLGTEILQQALRRQAEQPLLSSSHVCPVCSEPLDERPPEPRSVQTLLGVADWQEPASHCDRCRKAFFPSVQESGHGPGC
jgi:hypothetical protein